MSQRTLLCTPLSKRSKVGCCFFASVCSSLWGVCWRYRYSELTIKSDFFVLLLKCFSTTVTHGSAYMLQIENSQGEHFFTIMSDLNLTTFDDFAVT